MSKTLVLDLDKFEGDVKRTITIAGISYAVEEMSVDNFIETTRMAQALENKEDATIVDHVESTVQMILRSVPTAPVELLRAMSMVKLSIIVRFLQGEMDAEIEKAASAAAEAGGEEVKK